MAGARRRGRVCPSCRPRVACAPPSCCKGGEHERGHGEACWGAHASAPTAQAGECVRGWARRGCERACMWLRAHDAPMRVWGACVWVRVVRVRAGGRVVPVCGCVGCLPVWARAHPAGTGLPANRRFSEKIKKNPLTSWGEWVGGGACARRTALALRARRPILLPVLAPHATVALQGRGRGRVCWGAQANACRVALTLRGRRRL